MSGRTPINVSNFTVYHDVDETDDQFNLSTGASLIFRGDDVLSDDVFTGTGLVRVSGRATIAQDLVVDGDVTFANVGVVTQDSDDLLLGPSADSAVTVRNNSGATWDLTHGAGIIGAGASQLVNLGLFEQDSGVSTIDTNFYDRGGEIQANGTLDFAPVNAANRFVADTIGGAGTFELSGGGALVGSNISVATADLVNARVLGDVTISSATVDTGNLALNTGAVVSITNVAANVNFGDEIIGGGEIDIEGSATVFTAANAAANTNDDWTSLVGDVTIVNSGDTTFDGYTNELGGSWPKGYEFGTSLFTSPWAGDTITIENGAGATWTDKGLADSHFQQIGGQGNSVFINNGTFIEDTSFGVTFDIPIVNNGVIEAGANELQGNSFYFFINAPLSGTGAVDIGADGAWITGSVAIGQIVDFHPAPSGGQATRLEIDEPQSFYGTIAGFDENGATDDQFVFTTSSWQYQDFVANSNGTGGFLMFTNGGKETGVNLVGSYNPSGFQAIAIDNQTTITYHG